MIQIYNEDAAADKNYFWKHFDVYYTNRLKLMQELDGVEQGCAKFQEIQ
jgi:hypothetical protein